MSTDVVFPATINFTSPALKKSIPAPVITLNAKYVKKLTFLPTQNLLKGLTQNLVSPPFNN